MPVIECNDDDAATRLANAGVTIEAGNTDYERWRAEHEGGVAVAYDGKVVIQGASPHRLAALVRADSAGNEVNDGREGGEITGGTVGGRAYCYFDGASRGNPGPAAIGWVIVTEDGIVAEGGERIGETTNNRAEYEALIRVLEVAREYGFSDVSVKGDSQVVVRQVRGEYETANPDLRERRVTAHELLAAFDEWTIDHVPRAANDRADAQANEALDRE